MADQESCKDIHLLKRTKIPVYVDEALPDILVVTFQFGLKIFKGALLDSTKKSIPCGIPNINPAFNTSTKSKPDDDTLYSVNQRFAYTDPANAKKKNVHISTKYKKNKMTVRLRPRQVLCTKCKGICNENSENVTRKRKSTETIHAPPIKRSANAPVTRSVVNTTNNKKKVVVKRTLIPKAPQELPNALSGNINKININNNKKPLGTVSNIKACTATTNNTCDNSLKSSTDSSLGHSLKHSDSSNGSNADPKLKKVLRKKRSVGSIEDIWDEAACEETNKNNNLAMQNNANSSDQPLSSTCTNTRTIKICYGPQGEGTVLKIPAQIENLNLEDDLEENIYVEEKDNQKAARKAMKKAKKEAKRKIIHSGSSPDHTSPRFTVGGSSPRYTVGSASPRHGLGNNSPRYVATTLEPITPKKRKHKMKHKKKHREDKDRKHKDGEETFQEELHKETCLTQKLSINLKRLSTSYLASQGVIEKSEDSSSDEHSYQVPDFPAPDSAVLLRMNALTLTSAPGAEGVPLLIGDVVWGKIHGFPWWPGKVLKISDCDTLGPQAHIAWYGSSSSSLINCDTLSPYLDNFKIRYCKKKRGPYKDAIKQATIDARTHEEQKLDIESVVSSSARNIIHVVPPALSSPREINVIS